MLFIVVNFYFILAMLLVDFTQVFFSDKLKDTFIKFSLIFDKFLIKILNNKNLNIR